jgi:hypothetical protein
MVSKSVGVPPTPRGQPPRLLAKRVTVPVGDILIASHALSESSSHLCFRLILGLENTISAIDTLPSISQPQNFVWFLG